MLSLSEVISDIISLLITLIYMIIVWIIVDKLKFLSGLLNIYKKPLFLIIILTTSIPIYIILKRLLNNQSPLNINIGVNKTGSRQLKQMAGIDDRYVLPNDPNSEYRTEDVANKEFDEAQYADPTKGDEVAADTLQVNYQLGSPKDSKSRFIMHGKVCNDQDFLKSDTDDAGNPIEMVRVKWDLISNQSPRYCKTPGCIKGGNLSRDFGSMEINSDIPKEVSFYRKNKDSCNTPYRKLSNSRAVLDNSSESLNVFMKKNYKTFGQDLSVDECIEACDDERECRGFLYNQDTKEVSFFGERVVNDHDRILSAQGKSVYIKPPMTSLVPLKSLVKPDKLPYCSPETKLCRPAEKFAFAGRVFNLKDIFYISIDELDQNPLGPHIIANSVANDFWKWHKGEIPSWYVRVSLSDKPEKCFAMRRSSLQNGRMPYFMFMGLARTTDNKKASPLTTKGCADDPVNTPLFAKKDCPNVVRTRMGGGDNIPNATSCETEDCSLPGQYCPPSAPGSTPEGKRCCPRDGKFLWRNGARDCSYIDRTYEVPDATSCHGWECDLEGQYCPAGRPGSTPPGQGGYRCCDGNWRRGRQACQNDW